MQRILLDLLTDPRRRPGCRERRAEYARRRAAVVEALARLGVEVGGTEGINIWVPVHDETAAVVRLASQGIGVTPGSPFALLADSRDHIRVTVGLVREGHEQLAAQLAAAARTSAWGPRARCSDVRARVGRPTDRVTDRVTDAWAVEGPRYEGRRAGGAPAFDPPPNGGRSDHRDSTTAPATGGSGKARTGRRRCLEGRAGLPLSSRPRTSGPAKPGTAESTLRGGSSRPRRRCRS